MAIFQYFLCNTKVTIEHNSLKATYFFTINV
jgi:hypothetical protein